MSRLRRAFRLLGLEAGFAFAYESWIAPVYWGSLAGSLGLTVGWVSLLSMTPWLGQIGQLPALWFLARVKSVKRYTLWVTFVARAVWLIPLGLAVRWGLQSAEFPLETWFKILVGVSLVSSVFSASGAVAWMAWMKGLVPSPIQARFLGYRHRYVMVGLVTASTLAAWLSGWVASGQRLGALTLGGLGILSAGISLGLLMQVQGVTAAALEDRERIAADFFAPLRDKNFLRVLTYGAALNGGLQFAGAYFPYHFTKNLNVPLGTVIVWGMLTHLGCFLAAPFFAKRIDRLNQAPQIILITSILMALSPLFYVPASARFVFAVAPWDYLTNGMAWIGYFLGIQSLVFRSAPRDSSVAYFSWYAAVTGVTGATMAFVGGSLGAFLEPWGGLRMLFAISTVFRFLLIALLYKPCIGYFKTHTLGAT